LLVSEREAAWRDAADALERLLSLEIEAELFASNDAYQAIATAAQDIRDTAKAAEFAVRSEAVGFGDDKASAQRLQMYELAAKLMLHAASRLAKDVRVSLELDELSRDWRLYDHELEAHLTDLRERVQTRTDSRVAPATGAE